MFERTKRLLGYIGPEIAAPPKYRVVDDDGPEPEFPPGDQLFTVYVTALDDEDRDFVDGSYEEAVGHVVDAMQRGTGGSWSVEEMTLDEFEAMRVEREDED